MAGCLQFLINSCSWIVALLVVPLSLIYDFVWWFKARFIYACFGGNAESRHDEKVKAIQSQVQAWKESGSEQKMCTARPGYKSITLTPITYKDRMYKIEVDLPDILKIDAEKKIVRVEPSVTIGKLNDFLISRGWTLPVVPELDDLTIGGLVMGGGIETTSCKHGLFQYNCKAYELILSDGKKVWCSENENPDLYLGIPFSCGTLGFLTAVDLVIIPYQPYIKLTYRPLKSLDNIVEEVTNAAKNPSYDCVEGIAFSLDSAVLMTGIYVDKVPSGGTLNRMGKWYKTWFFKHVETFLDKDPSGSYVEYIPTKDYFHRHNKSIFWLIHGIIPFSNHPIFRYLFGWTMPPKWSFLKWIRENLVPGLGQHHLVQIFVCQDFIMDISYLKESLEFFDKIMNIYPVWMCPVKHPVPDGLEDYSIFDKNMLQVDIGIYGGCVVEDYDPFKSQRAMEEFTIAKKGTWMFPYAENHLTFEEVDTMFSSPNKNYENLRKKYNCEAAFPHRYEKISKMGRKSMIS